MKRFMIAVLVPVFVLCALGVSFISNAKTDTREEQVPFPDVPRMTKEELKELLGKPGLVLLDVRIEEEWTTSQQKLPGAVHENPLGVDSWANKYPKNATVVLY